MCLASKQRSSSTMSCPKRYFNTEIAISPKVNNSELFASNCVDEWALKNFLRIFDDSEKLSLKAIKAKRQEFVESLQALKRENLASDLSLYINELIKEKKFKQESTNSLRNGTATIESDTQRLLSQAHVMVLKKDEVCPELLSFVGKDAIDGLKQEVKDAFGLENVDMLKHRVQSQKHYQQIDKKKELNSRQASAKVMDLMTESKDTAVDDCILMVRNLLEKIPHKKTNNITKESNISCTFADAVLRPIIDNPDNDEFLVWSNFKISEAKVERPDITADTKFRGPSCVGEMKGEDMINDTRALATFFKEAIDTHSYKGVLGVHVVGFYCTFYITTLLSEGLYIMLEVCSIRIPSSLDQMKSFVANLEDLLLIKNAYQQCKAKNPEVAENKKKGANFQTICQLVKKGKNRKRPWSFVLNH